MNTIPCFFCEGQTPLHKSTQAGPRSSKATSNSNTRGSTYRERFGDDGKRGHFGTHLWTVVLEVTVKRPSVTFSQEGERVLACQTSVVEARTRKFVSECMPTLDFLVLVFETVEPVFQTLAVGVDA